MVEHSLDQAIDLLKAHVRSYQRRTKTGKLVTVREHEDSRPIAAESPWEQERRREAIPPEMRCRTCHGWGGVSFHLGFLRQTVPCGKCGGTGRAPGPLPIEAAATVHGGNR
jgi:hypothetical protein